MEKSPYATMLLVLIKPAKLRVFCFDRLHLNFSKKLKTLPPGAAPMDLREPCNRDHNVRLLVSCRDPLTRPAVAHLSIVTPHQAAQSVQDSLVEVVAVGPPV